jgi:hypothetical protein
MLRITEISGRKKARAIFLLNWQEDYLTDVVPIANKKIDFQCKNKSFFC